MEETDVYVQIYSFLEVMAVCYDEKPDKNVQMYKEVISVMLWEVGRFRAWQFDWINQPAAQKLSRYMFLKCIKPFPLKVNTQGTQRL